MIATSSVTSDTKLCKNNHYIGRIGDKYYTFKPYDYTMALYDDDEELYCAYIPYKDALWYDYEVENWRRVTEFHDLALVT